ncbi:MAG: Cys-tRNA(Pro) deacylase [Deltaproteobacteria bacterium]|jgi:Cys-tRNA(Pro)/Cys-tRNA(Cys) deacylase|nr:Cys-tRNA(Pro) deacylase [Deltaproteobacteria bacterium]MBT4525649.1 Cys-tRNA(Pro) deacylase [Deltaproteobacteria bacterium]
MTPAIDCAKRVGINFNIHEYDHDPTADSYGEEAVLKMGLDSGIVFKTLIVTTSDKQLLVAILPVAKQLNLKRFAKAVGMKKVVMAEKKSIENTTGYIPGGISPIGQKKQLSTVIDQSATQLEMIYVSAGRRGLQIELSPNDLIALTDGKFEKICD